MAFRNGRRLVRVYKLPGFVESVDSDRVGGARALVRLAKTAGCHVWSVQLCASLAFAAQTSQGGCSQYSQVRVRSHFMGALRMGLRVVVGHLFVLLFLLLKAPDAPLSPRQWVLFVVLGPPLFLLSAWAFESGKRRLGALVNRLGYQRHRRTVIAALVGAALLALWGGAALLWPVN